MAEAHDELAQAEQELADAQVGLEEARSSTSGTPGTPASTPTPATAATTTIVPAATLDRVERAEEDLAVATASITDQTPLTGATAQLNAAAFAVEAAALQLFADAGCLTTEQERQATTAVAEYTAALQTSLQAAGYYGGEIDGIYGPGTVDAVESLQADSGLAITGLVDDATAAALDAAVRATGTEATADTLADTAALQAVLKLAGYWTGPVDGQWTPELTAALEAFQTALGVPPTGAVDAATLSALQQAIADAETTAPTSSSQQ